MATTHADRTASVEEIDGVISAVTRIFRVSAVAGSDYNKVIDAMEDAGVPAFNSVLDSSHTNLRLTRRSAVAIGNQGTNEVYDVTCEYQRVGEGAVDILFSGSATLQQITTENDNQGSQILLSHTFPDDDVDFGLGTLFNPSADTPKEVLQGGEISVFSPTATISSTQIINTNVPTNVGLGWVGHVNSQSWGGSGIRQWMCTDVSYILLDKDASPEQWTMTFEFQFKAEGWAPTAIFIDPRTGRPPQDLVEDEGIKDIFWHPERNFNTLFPT